MAQVVLFHKHYLYYEHYYSLHYKMMITVFFISEYVYINFWSHCIPRSWRLPWLIHNGSMRGYMLQQQHHEKVVKWCSGQWCYVVSQLPLVGSHLISFGNSHVFLMCVRYSTWVRMGNTEKRCYITLCCCILYYTISYHIILYYNTEGVFNRIIYIIFL